jgi:hypothetical protein
MTTDDLEKKLEVLSARMEERLEAFGKRLEERFDKTGSESVTPVQSRGRKSETPFWGIVLVLGGFILLGEHLHWFNLDIPFLPAALIILGSYLIIENRHNS